MEIEKIAAKNDGYVNCLSCFYSSLDILPKNHTFVFHTGVNKLIGEIDSGVWAISYLMSMYKYRPKDFVLFKPLNVTVNDMVISLDDMSEYSCYMDKLYPLFSAKASVRKLVFKGLKKRKLNYSPDDIRDIFHISEERFERPLTSVGNEVFKAMAAIGYSYGKQIFCFPWLSQKRFNGYHRQITGLLEILESLKVTAIVPIGRTE